MKPEWSIIERSCDYVPPPYDETLDKRTDEANIYYSKHRVEYKEPSRQSGNCFPVLEFLKGRQWDNFALGIVHSLRPSCIRVTYGEVTCDSCHWRVTVYVDDDSKIKRIEQEVVVGLYGCRNGSDIDCILKGKKPPEGDQGCIINTNAIKVKI